MIRRSRPCSTRLLVGALLAGVLAGAPSPAPGGGAAAAADVEADPGPTRVVAEVPDAGTLVLDGGDVVRLLGLMVPRPAGRRDGEREERAGGGDPASASSRDVRTTGALREARAAGEAREALVRLVGGRRVRLIPPGRFRAGSDVVRDRYGRQVAHVETDSAWVQGEMLRGGWATVWTAPGQGDRAADMLRLEAEARAAGRGLWGRRFHVVRSPDDLGGRLGTFQLVEGVVTEVARVRGRIFVNFGPDWRTDFTGVMMPESARLFARSGIDPLVWRSRRMRLRGWIDWHNGPEIELTHPEQVEDVSGADD